jgi:general secretion pathway protein A
MAYGGKMYKDFYGMKIEAFVNQPLPDMFFNSRSHKEAWHYLAYGINSKEPFMLLCGDYGMGKTTLCLRLVQSLKEVGRLPFVFLSTPVYSYLGLLAKIAACLDVPLEQGDESSIQNAIVKSLEDRRDGNGMIIIFDDAHEVDLSVLSKARMLASFNIDGYFPIRLLLFSHLSFLDKLKSDPLLPLNQRIKRRFYLEPLDLFETKEYIYFRMVRAGAPGVPAFSDSAIQVIFDGSRGIPRNINNICDACLLVGATDKLHVIDDFVVSKALDYAEGAHVRPPSKVVTSQDEPELRAAQADVRPSDTREVPFRITLNDFSEEPPAKPPPGVAAPIAGSSRPAARAAGHPLDVDGFPPRVALDFPPGSDRAVRIEHEPVTRNRFKLRDLVAVAVLVFILAMVLASFVDFKAITAMFNGFLALIR